MNAKLLLFAITAAIFCSCSSTYKVTQTPDDVYYSPVRFYDEGKKVEKKEKEVGVEERQIRLGINDPRWRYFDNDVSYSPYSYGYNYGYYYNPYYCSFPIYNPVLVTYSNPKVTTPRTTNLAAYNSNYNNSNAYNIGKTGIITTSPVRTYNNTNYRGSKIGSTFNKIFNSSPSNSSTESNSSRTYTPSSSSSSSSSSGSSSSGGSSRPARSGKN